MTSPDSARSPLSSPLLTSKGRSWWRSPRFWARRTGGFFLTVLLVCAAVATLFAVGFALFGTLGGSRQTVGELTWRGAKSGAFFGFVWAPGIALVVEFMRGARERRAASK